MGDALSVDVGRAALKLALTASREEEQRFKRELAQQGIKGVAVDYGGEFLASFAKSVERALVAARRENVIAGSHLEEGAVAGATREALSQVMPRAMGLNVGGKIAVSRQGEHVAVAVFFGIGLLHLNEVAAGLGHRAVPESM